MTVTLTNYIDQGKVETSFNRRNYAGSRGTKGHISAPPTGTI